MYRSLSANIKKHSRILFFLLAPALLFTACGPKKPTGPLVAGGDFTLTDHNGNEFHLSDLKGKAVYLYFGYTVCPDACPFTLSKVRRVYDLLEDRSKQVQTVFVSVDPQRDTPEKLKKYLSYYKVGAIGVTGEDEVLADIAKRYEIKYQKVKTDSAVGYLMDHTTSLLLLDQNGEVRYRFRHKDDPRLMASITKLILPSL